MADTTNDDVATTASHALEHAFAVIHQAHPFMNADSIKTALAKVSEQLARELDLLEPATTATKSRFNFNKLPAELRIQIYELVLAHYPYPWNGFETQLQKYTATATPSDAGWGFDGTETAVLPSRMPALLHVNRQIRQEALPIFCKETTFVATFRSTKVPERGVSEWLNMIGATAASKISRLEIEFVIGNGEDGVAAHLDEANRQASKSSSKQVRVDAQTACASVMSLRCWAWRTAR